MRYSLLLHYPELPAEAMVGDAVDEARREFASYTATLHAAGVLISAEVLQPSEVSTTVRVVDGALQVQDGPFADTKEQLGGTVVIDVPDLDRAIEVARQAPSVTWGAVEVRPSATHTVDGVWTTFEMPAAQAG